MSNVTLYLSDDVFDLEVNPLEELPFFEYAEKEPAEKLRIHEEELVKEVEAILNYCFGIDASVNLRRSNRRLG